MNSTFKIIIIIFAVFFVLSIVVTFVFRYMQKKGTLDGNDQAISDTMGVIPQEYSKTRYSPKVVSAYHIQRNLADDEFGHEVEIIEGKKAANIIMGLVWIGVGVAFVVMRKALISITSVEDEHIIVNGIVFACAAGCILCGLYCFSFLGRQIVFYETGLIYTSMWFKEKRVSYSGITRVSVGREFFRGMGSSSISQHLSVKFIANYLMYFRMVFRIFIKEKTITGENKHIEFWGIHYKHLTEKALNFQESMKG